jgi:hypothetical protein
MWLSRYPQAKVLVEAIGACDKLIQLAKMQQTGGLENLSKL